MNTGTELTRVYTGPYARVAHLLFTVTGPDALCGRNSGLWHDWMGTGNQEEYDRAAALPLCRICKGRA